MNHDSNDQVQPTSTNAQLGFNSFSQGLPVTFTVTNVITEHPHLFQKDIFYTECKTLSIYPIISWALPFLSILAAQVPVVPVPFCPYSMIHLSHKWDSSEFCVHMYMI